nr:MAG TPA: DNA repair protein endonuclease SAE2/CtIP C-terminus [Caudoviricetes sp.]
MGFWKIDIPYTKNNTHTHVHRGALEKRKPL